MFRRLARSRASRDPRGRLGLVECISEPLSSCPTDNAVANDRRNLVLDGSVGAPSPTQRDAVRRAASCARAAAWLLIAASAIDATHRPTLRGCWPRPGDAHRAIGQGRGAPLRKNDVAVNPAEAPRRQAKAQQEPKTHPGEA